MVNRYLPAFFFCFFLSYSHAQEVTYEQLIAPIIQKNCVSCHRSGGYGPFPLTTYADVQKRGKFIAHVTKTKYMPPWKADPSFSHFKNERILTDLEIDQIQLWVAQGMKRGEVSSQSPVDSHSVSFTKPDLVLSMNSTFQLSTKGIEDYRFFHVPTHLDRDVYVSAIGFMAGNKRYVRHSRIMVDTSGQISGIDGLSEFDPRSLAFQTKPLMDEFLYGWVPGNIPVAYPSGTAKLIPKGADLIFNIHYAPSSESATDLSEVHLYFSDVPVKHLIKSLSIREEDIANQPFVIRSETSPTFYVSKVLEEDMNVVSLLPHMHFLGKSMTALAILPDQTQVPLISIPEWDYNWQSTYMFESPVFLPKGTLLLLTATFDNTSNNPLNPTIPPKDVTYGWNSTDEMMNLVMYYY